MDWIHCNECYALPNDARQAYFLTSCGHIFCIECKNKAEGVAGICKMCRRECKTLLLYLEKMPDEAHKFFADPVKHLENVTETLNEIIRVCSFQEKQKLDLVKHLKNKQMQKVNQVEEEIKKFHKKLWKFERDNETLKKENENLKNYITQLQFKASGSLFKTPQKRLSGYRKARADRVPFPLSPQSQSPNVLSSFYSPISAKLKSNQLHPSMESVAFHHDNGNYSLMGDFRSPMSENRRLSIISPKFFSTPIERDRTKTNFETIMADIDAGYKNSTLNQVSPVMSPKSQGSTIFYTPSEEFPRRVTIRAPPVNGRMGKNLSGCDRSFAVSQGNISSSSILSPLHVQLPSVLEKFSCKKKAKVVPYKRVKNDD